MKIELIVSGDGSHTLFLPELNETYHSHHGALRESLYVFIEKGLEVAAENKNTVTVFEVGFGTGLNALLTLMWAENKKIHIDYHTLEPYPLSKEITEKLNYLDLLGRKDLEKEFQTMHETEEGTVQLNGTFAFSRYKSTLENFSSDLHADVIYYDAFAPNKQPEVWSLENIRKVRSLLSSPGLLVSYCASGQFKRNLKEAGFEVETLPGPPGKKEMTRGKV